MHYCLPLVCSSKTKPRQFSSHLNIIPACLRVFAECHLIFVVVVVVSCGARSWVGDHVAPSFSWCTCSDDGVLVGCRIQPFSQASAVVGCQYSYNLAIFTGAGILCVYYVCFDCDIWTAYRLSLTRSLKEGSHWRSGRPSKQLVFLTTVRAAVRTVVRTAVKTAVKNTNRSDGCPDLQCGPSFSAAICFLSDSITLLLYTCRQSQITRMNPPLHFIVPLYSPCFIISDTPAD